MPLLKMLLQFWGELRNRKPFHAVFNHSAAESAIRRVSELCGAWAACPAHGFPAAQGQPGLLLQAVICTRDVKFPGARQLQGTLHGSRHQPTRSALREGKQRHAEAATPLVS